MGKDVMRDLYRSVLPRAATSDENLWLGETLATVIPIRHIIVNKSTSLGQLYGIGSTIQSSLYSNLSIVRMRRPTTSGCTRKGGL